jgi:hypothetical protein
MRRVAWLLVAAFLCAFPSRTLADSHWPFGQRHAFFSCSISPHDEDAMRARSLRCAVGVAVKVSSNGMRVRPLHGSPLRVRFTDETEFETNSGEGVLDGLVAGDYVCVAYVPRSGTVTALFVAFDPQWIPCGVGKHNHFATGVPPEGGSD